MAARILRLVARALWASLMVLTPLFAFWIASSLAAYYNATQWFALLVGLLLFPLLPVGWDLVFVWRRNRAKATRPPILTRLDRLVLRTLLINGVFLGGVMWKAREASFRALAVRGDWMLDGHDGPLASKIRHGLLAFANRLDRHTTARTSSTYGTSDEGPDTTNPFQWTPPKAWPLPAAIDPAVTSMPESEQSSPEAVGQYLAARATSKRLLVKMIHDYIALRLHYEHDVLKKIEAKDFANLPEQTADAVFSRRGGVCAGYAHLFVAIAKAAGLDAAYITGLTRNREQAGTASDDPWSSTQRDSLEGTNHAWNAVKLEDGWHLVDVTWDDSDDDTIDTDYLLTPPALMGTNHFPTDEAWQLRSPALSLGDFIRQPLMTPTLGALGLTLQDPLRSQITVDGAVDIKLANPDNAVVFADTNTHTRCDVTPGATTLIHCDLASGEHEVRLFGGPAGSMRGSYMGSIFVNSR